jgi:putative transposase
LHSPRFVDRSPTEAYATLLDEGQYLGSPRTMYRVLATAKEVRERRNQLRHPNYVKPELLATAPNQLWSWDGTKLKGAAKWTYHCLLVLLDVYSRCVVGWMIAGSEAAWPAKRLIEETCDKQRIKPGDLIIHADRGTAMTSKTLGQLYSDLGIEGSHSRPRVSNDNPFSESQFRTLKYRPEFPDRFGSPEHARQMCGALFRW